MWPEGLWFPELAKGVAGLVAFGVLFRLAWWRWVRDGGGSEKAPADLGLD
jgi:hypothetical protein